MRILFTIQRLKHLTGSEMFAYELCRQLALRHEVTIAADEFAGDIPRRLKKLGVKVCHFEDVKGDFDIIHANQAKGARFALHERTEPILQTVHSHYIFEHPVFSERMKRYVAVRPQVAEYIVDKFEIPPEKVAIILNPIDTARFKPKPREKDKYVILAPCTLEQVRQKFVDWLIARAGPNCTIRFLSDGEIKRNPYIEVVKPVWNVERYVQQSDEVASFHVGRVNFEAMACGVPTTVFTDEDGGRFLRPVEPWMYDSRSVARQYETLYKEIINGS